MYVSHELQLIYLAQPRTASRAVATYLQSICELGTWGIHHSVDRPKVAELKAGGYRVLTTVRNHWDVVVSWFYHNPHWFRRDSLFPEFARTFVDEKRNPYVKPHQMYWRYQPLATHVMRWETLWVDLEEILQVEIEDPPVVGKTLNRKPYPDYYDAELRDFIGDWYKDEIRLYEYDF